MKSLLFIGLFILIAIVALLAAVQLFVPDTRTGTYTVRLRGTLEEVWAVYTDPQSQPTWREEVAEVTNVTGDIGARAWTEVDSRGLRIDFVETAAERPRLYDLQTASDGYFTGRYQASFELIVPNLVEGTFTEEVTTTGFRAKLLAWLFVNPEHLITTYARDAQSEIDRRRSAGN